MTAVLLSPLFEQFSDSNGNPLSGGLLYSYVAGTTTPQATYTDATGTIPASNPVVLNSAGRADIWGSGTYKFILKDSLGNTIGTVDNVTAIYGAGDMTKTIYDPANIAQQIVGTTAVQTISNKTLTGAVIDTTSTGVTQTAGNNTTALATTAFVQAASGMVLLNTLTASASTFLSDATNITSTYSAYLFVFENILPATNAVKFRMRISVDGGATFPATGYLDLSTNTDGIYVSGNTSTVGNTANYGLNGNLYLYNPSATGYKMTTSSATFYTGAAIAGFFNGGGLWNTATTAINGVLFAFTSGNIASGTIKIFGIK